MDEEERALMLEEEKERDKNFGKGLENLQSNKKKKEEEEKK